MCGLFGCVGLALTTSQEDRIIAALKGRGPDSQGRWNDRRATFLHTRLAIQDLSPLGHQPMLYNSGELVLVFNGEIYNQNELRRQLEAEGATFRSSSDTEVLLEGFRLWGNSIWARLNGIFAVAIWDAGREHLILARDNFGVKPLLWQRNGDQCAFGSELSAFEAAGLASRNHINPEALVSYIFWGAVAAPKTLLADVEVFPAGHWGQWSAQQGWQIQPFGHAKDEKPIPRLTLGDASLAIEQALRQAVERQIIGDVPVGLFLSGGLDSGLLASLLREQHNGSIHSMSVGFEGLPNAIDETPLAELTAQHLKLTHRSLKISPEVLDGHLDEFIDAIDQPSIDGFNSFLVSQAAAADGMKVAFSGLGADELFGGYAHMGGTTLKQALVARRIRAHGLSNSDRRSLIQERQGLIESQPTGRILTLRNCSELELAGYLRDTLLRDSDAVTMHNGLELRVPFLDRDVVQLAMSIGDDLHQSEGPKTLLRRVASGRLPDAVLRAPKKGFNLALGHWLAGSPRFAPQRIGRLVSQNLDPQNLRISQRALWSSWALMRASRRWGPYWRWVVLGEWLHSREAS